MKFTTLAKLLERKGIVYGPEHAAQNVMGLAYCFEQQMILGNVLEAEDVFKEIDRAIAAQQVDIDSELQAQLFKQFALLCIIKDDRVKAAQALQRNKQAVAVLSSPEARDFQRYTRHFVMAKFCLLTKNDKLAEMQMSSLHEMLKSQGFGSAGQGSRSMTVVEQLAAARYFSATLKVSSAVKCYQKAGKSIDLQAEDESFLINQVLLANSELGALKVASGDNQGLELLRTAYSNSQRLMAAYHPYAFIIAKNLIVSCQLASLKGFPLDQYSYLVQEAREQQRSVNQGASQEQLSQIMQFYRKGVQSKRLADRIQNFTRAIGELQPLACFSPQGWFSSKFKMALAETLVGAARYQQAKIQLQSAETYFQSCRCLTGMRALKSNMARTRISLFQDDLSAAEYHLSRADRLDRQLNLGYSLPISQTRQLIDHPELLIRPGKIVEGSAVFSNQQIESIKSKKKIPNIPNRGRPEPNKAKPNVRDRPSDRVAQHRGISKPFEAVNEQRQSSISPGRGQTVSPSRQPKDSFKGKSKEKESLSKSQIKGPGEEKGKGEQAQEDQAKGESAPPKEEGGCALC